MVLGTLVVLALYDVLVGAVLHLADGRGGPFAALSGFFEYGRSVPGKLQRWEKRPETPGNLFDVAWRPTLLNDSARLFAAEPTENGPVVRSYGMSFVNDVLEAAERQDPNLVVDMHAGPAAPPNFTYALFLDDAPNQRRGDVVVLGILSSSLPGLAALSNRTWLFEQPAPFTYPVFLPEGTEGLSRLDPLVESAEQERGLPRDPLQAAQWEQQLATQDRLFTAAAFGAPWLDASPFARLVRRAAASHAITARKAEIQQPDGSFPVDEILRRMVRQFAARARADGLLPVVLLIQSNHPRERNLLDITRTVLAADNIPYLATQELHDPRDPSGYLPDGHFTGTVNDVFGQEFRNILARSH